MITPMPSFKSRLLKRFSKQRELIGADWKGRLAKADPFFNTKVGSDYMTRASNAVMDPNRISVERLERVVLTMEVMTGTYKEEKEEAEA